MPEPTDDLLAGLRRAAAALDDAAPPIPANEARRAPTTARTPGPPRWLPAAAAAVFVLVIGGVAWAALAGGDPEDVVTPSETTTSSTTTVPDRLPVDLGSLPETGIAIEGVDGSLDVYDLDGNPLGRIPEPSAPRDGYEVMLPSGTTPEPLDPAEVPAGCDRAFGAGGIRVAICGDSQVLDVVDAAGGATRLSGPPFDDTPGSRLTPGQWRWAIPSPDGRWVLAQWVDGCGSPMAFVSAVGSSGVPLVAVHDTVESYAVGWVPDGRAIVQTGHARCGAEVREPGVHLLDPGTMEMEQFLAQDQPWRAFAWRNEFGPQNAPERLVSRALRELGLEPCCGEPSHGGTGVTSGAAFEGQQIAIGAVPIEEPASLPEFQTLPLLHGEAAVAQSEEGPIVSFTCGLNRYSLGSWPTSDAEVDSMLLLAEALVPHLYCTLGPPPP